MRLIQAFMILLLVLLFFQLTPLILWILKLLLALGFLSLAYDSYKEDRPGMAVLYVFLALLFQPLVNIGLGRALWSLVQIIILVWLLSLIFRKDDTF